MHLPGADLRGDVADLFHVRALHMSAEAVHRVIGDLHGLVHGIVGQIARTGPKISSCATPMSRRTSEKIVGRA